MKNTRSGRARILDDENLEELLEELERLEPKYKALFAIAYYTSCRISEALKLQASDLKGDRIIFRASTTKTKTSREVKITSKLASILEAVELPKAGYLFPGKNGDHLTRQAADKALRYAAAFIGLEGVSTHSMRRTGITKLHRAGIPLATIQAHTGHKSLGSLGHYIGVSQAEVDAAVELL